MARSLGQIALDAYDAAQFDPDKDEWQAAAEAVAAKIGNRELQAKSLEELDRELAVIEAAKAQRRVLRHKPSIHSSDAVIAAWNQRVRETTDAFEAALDALDSEEE